MKNKLIYISYDDNLVSDSEQKIIEYENKALERNLVYENADHSLLIFKVDNENFADHCLVEKLGCGYTEWIEFPNYVVVEIYRGRITSLETYRESGLFRDEIADFKGDKF